MFDTIDLVEKIHVHQAACKKISRICVTQQTDIDKKFHSGKGFLRISRWT